MLVAHSLAYNFVTDDAYISFVFARNFAEHGQLAFNLGQPVEGYTNFLWTVVLGALMVAGVSPELSSRVLGTACGLATLYVVFRLVERALGRKTMWAAVPPLLLACSSGFACWTSGGLETQLFTLLCTIALHGVVAAETEPRALHRAGIALALAAMTRPEGLLVAAVLGGARYIQLVTVKRRWTVRQDFIAAGLFLVVWAPWFAWRWHYYGWPFPNTYYVKATGAWTGADMAHRMWDSGTYYLWVWLKQTRLLYALPIAALGLVAVRPRTPRFALAVACILLAAVYLPYTASVGGDFMGLHRFIMPMFVVAAIAVVLGLERLASWVPATMRANVGAAAATLGLLAFALTQMQLTIDSTRSCASRSCPNDHGIDSPAFLMIYTADRAAIGRATASCFRDDDFSIVGGAGAQPYFARMRGIDVYGLVSDRIAHEEPRSNPRAGHTKWGNDRLLAEYDPNFVFSCYQIHRDPKPPPLPCNVGYWTARGFEQVTLFVPEMRERGQYYTFLAKKSREFECPGRVTLMRLPRWWGAVPLAIAVALFALRACVATPPLSRLAPAPGDPRDPPGSTAEQGSLLIARGGPVILGSQSNGPARLTIGDHDITRAARRRAIVEVRCAACCCRRARSRSGSPAPPTHA